MFFWLNRSILKLITKRRVIRRILPRHWSSLSDYEIQYLTSRSIKLDAIPLALYGGRHTVTMIPGSGIGPECSSYVREVFRYIHAPVDFEIIDIDAAKDINAEFENALMSVERNGVAIKGHLLIKNDELSLTIRNVALRTVLDLYVYVLHCKSYPGVRAKHTDIDIVVIRQNTEGEYMMLEHSVLDKVVESMKVITRSNSLRVAKHAFEYAKKYGRKKVTTVHKANIMKLSDGLFLECTQEIAKEYPEIKHDDIIVDNCCMQLVKNPEQFDILLTPNLYGNILASIISGMIGGPGLVAAKNYGNHFAIFEPGMRNVAIEIANKNIANPIAMLKASVDMLYHLGHAQHAKKIENAIWKTLVEDKIYTPDIGGTASSTDIITNIIDLCTRQ